MLSDKSVHHLDAPDGGEVDHVDAAGPKEVLGAYERSVLAYDDVVEEGEAGRHMTAAGEDVSGFRYVAFANGLRLYYQLGLDLIVVDEPVAID